MDKFKEMVQNFMQTRNGMDELGKVIGISATILLLLGAVLKNGTVATLGVMTLIYFLIRFLHLATLHEKRKIESF